MPLLLRKSVCLLLICLSIAGGAVAQQPVRETETAKPIDTIPIAGTPASDTVPSMDPFVPDIDTSMDYDAFFDEMKDFLDSLLNPGSYLQVSLAINNGYFNYKVPGQLRVQSRQRYTLSPSVSYYHKSGLGISGSASLIAADNQLKYYQGSITPSYDYLQNLRFATGVSYTRYLARDTLPFYLSPLKNEIAGYFVYRKWWLWPSISGSYAWGTREDYKDLLPYIRSLRLRRRVSQALSEHEQISDFSLSASVSHNFLWLDVGAKGSSLRLIPQLMFTAGTQQYGFNRNQTRPTIAQMIRSNSLNSSEAFSLATSKDFEPLSLSLLLRGQYSYGKFFVQPQFMLDYYFPANDGNLTALFTLNLGFNF